MAKKNDEESWNTISFSKIFSNKVYVDLTHRVLYDRSTRCSIGYITSNNSKVEIHMELFFIINNNNPLETPDVKKFFNCDYITIKGKEEIRFNYNGGYIVIGNVSGNARSAELALPRIYKDRDDEQIDDVDIEADPDPDDMEPEPDPQATNEMIAKLIS